MCPAAHRTPCNVSLRGRFAPVAIRIPCLRVGADASVRLLYGTSCPAHCIRRLPFFPRRKKGRKERRQNLWFWNPFRGRGVGCVGAFLPRESGCAKSRLAFVSSLRLIPRRTLRLCWLCKQGCRLRLPCGAMWASPLLNITFCFQKMNSKGIIWGLSALFARYTSRQPVRACTALPGRAHGPRPTKCCVTGTGRTGPSAPTVGCVPALYSKITAPLFFSARPDWIRASVSAKGSLVCSPVFMSLQATTPAAISSPPRKIT